MLIFSGCVGDVNRIQANKTQTHVSCVISLQSFLMDFTDTGVFSFILQYVRRTSALGLKQEVHLVVCVWLKMS